MANNKMLIDASHEEETRVVVVRGNKVDEFDFESENKKQLRGNIYLAKVTRVEPSLQAAFVDYGGNRHGFLAFNEIHPDYYQIPMADRQALLEAEEQDALAQDMDDEEDGKSSRQSSRNGRRKSTRSRSRKKSDASADEVNDEDAVVADSADEDSAVSAEVTEAQDTEEKPKKRRTRRPRAKKADTESTKPSTEEATSDDAVQADGEKDAEEKPKKKPARRRTKKAIAEEEAKAKADAEKSSDDDDDDEPSFISAVYESDDVISEPAFGEDDGRKNDDEVGDDDVAEASSDDDALDETNDSDNDDDEPTESTAGSDDNTNGDEEFDSVGSEDAMEEVPRRRVSRRQYKIQEVIKRRQIILVQVVKEERGNKGAALTTYLSLAGRYSVLMPNTARGGGISRKITNITDRKRLKSIASDLDVAKGMGVILRTAGASRTKAEINRDFEYLLRLWGTVRNLTLESSAPCLVYEEGSLIKRSIRDLYNKDTGEVIVAGEAGYREAKDFMAMLMPSHAKNVKLYKDRQPLFAKSGVEQQLDKMLQPQVTMRSGGYLVINQTEALVSIDVNSGRSTREHSIEETALQTNLEASDEVARQLRLRDLAGLIVIDFIDMEEKRNNRAVEKRLKDALKDDRARIQVGRISHFGLMEMSRQRIRASVLESTTQVCPVCEGVGHVRSPSSIALHVIRSIEEHLQKSSRHNINVMCMTQTALYILNQKRMSIVDLEQRYGVSITLESDESVGNQYLRIERGTHASPRQKGETHVQMDTISPDEEDTTDNIASDEEASDEDRPRKKRRRRRGGRGRNNNGEDNFENTDDNEEQEAVEAGSDTDDDDENGEGRKRRRRRGRRGGRRNRRDTEDGENNTDEVAAKETTQDGGADDVTSEVAASDSEAVPEKPKRARRSKKSVKNAEEASDTETALADATEVEAEKPKRKPRRKAAKKDDEASDETAESSSSNIIGKTDPEPVEAAPSKTRRKSVADAAPPEIKVTSEAGSSAGDSSKAGKKSKGGWWQRNNPFSKSE